MLLKRNLDLVLLDAHNPFGNGNLLPLGPLREPPAHLQRADAIVLTRAEVPRKSSMTHSKITSLLPGKPVFSCIHRLTELSMGLDGQRIPLEALRGRKAIAFAGVARPESLSHLLRKAGIVVSWSFDFPDHYQYREADMSKLLNCMKESDTPFIITTEKDMVRLEPRVSGICSGSSIGTGLPTEHPRPTGSSPGKTSFSGLK